MVYKKHVPEIDRILSNDIWTHDRIMETWNNNATRLTPQLAKRLEELETTLKDIKIEINNQYNNNKYLIDIINKNVNSEPKN